MNFNLFNSLILAGVIQGFVFASIWAFTKKYRAKSTRYLIALIVVYSLSNLQFYLLDVGYFENVSFYDIYYTPFALLMPALLLLYGMHLLENEYRLRKSKWLLFMPFVIIYGLACYYKFQLIYNNKESGYSTFLDEIPIWSEFIAILYSVGVLVFLLIQLHKKTKNHSFSLSEISPHLNWFKTIIIVQLLSTMLWLYSELYFSSENDTSFYYPLWIVLSIIIYWMGHVGMYKYGISEERKKIRKSIVQKSPITEISASENEIIKALNLYIVTERNFLNPQLTLESVATQLQISQGHLSKTVNTELNVNFKEYINTLRISEAKKYMLDPSFSNYTLVAIGLEAGFNSKSTFNATFKKTTGLTPSQFKIQHNN